MPGARDKDRNHPVQYLLKVCGQGRKENLQLQPGRKGVFVKNGMVSLAHREGAANTSQADKTEAHRGPVICPM